MARPREVDPWDPTPIYLQIAGFLREDIESGKLAPGAQLPSEKEVRRLRR